MDMGYGSAMAWVLFVLIIFITAVIFKSHTRWVHYGK
jgi:multiple sugar transport system permease protein